MITLDVEDYCQSCKEFDPESEMIERSFVGSSIKEVDTIVRCSQSNKCKRLCEFLKKKVVAFD